MRLIGERAFRCVGIEAGLLEVEPNNRPSGSTKPVFTCIVHVATVFDFGSTTTPAEVADGPTKIVRPRTPDNRSPSGAPATFPLVPDSLFHGDSLTNALHKSSGALGE